MKEEKPSKFVPIGWQGLQFELPENWNFVAESGDQKEGFIRVSSLYANVELKWGKITNPSKFSTESVKDKLFQKLKKSDRKLQATTEKPSKLFGHDCINFDLVSNYRGRGVIWFCENIGKMFIVILTASPERFKLAVSDFERLLRTTRCHSDKAWYRWAVFGFSFRAPSTFELRERKFLVGHGTVVLSTLESHLLNKMETQAVFQYWGAANVNFEDAHANMKSWFEDFYQKELKKRYGRKTEQGRFRRITINGHSAMMLKVAFKKGLINTGTNQCSVCIWFCQNTNRVYAMTLSNIAYRKAFIPSGEAAKFPSRMLDQMVSSVRCH